jgi:hypothetical protein
MHCNGILKTKREFWTRRCTARPEPALHTANQGQEGFSFEKKKQKSLSILGLRRRRAVRHGNKSFLILFFKKERLPYSVSPATNRSSQ